MQKIQFCLFVQKVLVLNKQLNYRNSAMQLTGRFEVLQVRILQYCWCTVFGIEIFRSFHFDGVKIKRDWECRRNLHYIEHPLGNTNPIKNKTINQNSLIRKKTYHNVFIKLLHVFERRKKNLQIRIGASFVLLQVINIKFLKKLLTFWHFCIISTTNR